MPRWPWSRSRPPMREADVLRDIAPETRRQYRDLDLAAIVARIDRFSVSVVDSAWTRLEQHRKRHPDATVGDPIVDGIVRDSALAIVNFIRHQLYDPGLRQHRTLVALEAQHARWQTVAAADPAVLGAAAAGIERLRAAAVVSSG
ncbi:MAG: hypothetical protein U0556_05535 [Dehalococcoidia bacterium]